MRKPPSGAKFYSGTWAGRIFIINSVIFLWMVISDGSILMPSEDMLLRAGAKDPVKIALGEWWRFLTPVFVHIGIIHFGFNSLALRIIGAQVEHVVKWKWFLAVYLFSGIAGNVASSHFNVIVGAGASGAIFGLLGCGLIIEKLIAKDMQETYGKKLNLNTYTSMAVLNLILGFVIPGIDNAAHIGGFVAGMAVTLAMLWMKPNRLLKPNKNGGRILLVILAAVLTYGAALSMDKNYTLSRLMQRGDREANTRYSYMFYSDALQLDPEHSLLRFKRGRLLLIAGEVNAGLYDISFAVKDESLKDDLYALSKQMQAMERTYEALEILRLMSEANLRRLPKPAEN